MAEEPPEEPIVSADVVELVHVARTSMLPEVLHPAARELQDMLARDGLVAGVGPQHLTELFKMRLTRKQKIFRAVAAAGFVAVITIGSQGIGALLTVNQVRRTGNNVSQQFSAMMSQTQNQVTTSANKQIVKIGDGLSQQMAEASDKVVKQFTPQPPTPSKSKQEKKFFKEAENARIVIGTQTRRYDYPATDLVTVAINVKYDYRTPDHTSSAPIKFVVPLTTLARMPPRDSLATYILRSDGKNRWYLVDKKTDELIVPESDAYPFLSGFRKPDFQSFLDHGLPPIQNPTPSSHPDESLSARLSHLTPTSHLVN